MSMDDLRHLLSAYFYELLLRTLGRARVRLVRTRGRRLRQALGCCYAPAEGDRLWLLAVRDRLGEATPNQDVHRT